jgi:hypothetical protein
MIRAGKRSLEVHTGVKDALARCVVCAPPVGVPASLGGASHSASLAQDHAPPHCVPAPHALCSSCFTAAWAYPRIPASVTPHRRRTESRTPWPPEPVIPIGDTAEICFGHGDDRNEDHYQGYARGVLPILVRLVTFLPKCGDGSPLGIDFWLAGLSGWVGLYSAGFQPQQS